MILFPSAKINLGLQILRKREDGYHDIATCMVPVPLFDVLEILPSDTIQFYQTGLEIPDSTDNNLVLKAWRLLSANYNVPPAYFHLRKQIPMGAGLGGGSADAAFALLGMNELFDLGISNERLRGLAAELGSDCAFFIDNKPQLAEGRGELLTSLELSLRGYYLKLVHPEIHISTAQAYAGVCPKPQQYSIPEILKRRPEEWINSLHNDFEDSIFPSFPTIKALKDTLYQEGAFYASMSGSGSAVYGLFSEKPSEHVLKGNAWVLSL